MIKILKKLKPARKTSLASAWVAAVAAALSANTGAQAQAQGAAPNAPVASSASAEPPPMRAVRLNPGEKITLDGSLSASAWSRAPVFSQFTEHQPQHGKPAKFQTRVQVLFDEQALYFGITAIDPAPDLLRAELVRHDQLYRTQDFLVIYVDAVGRKKSANFYRVNALGLTGDGLHTADNDNEDFSPDHDYEAASQRTPNGFTSVVRIPYSGLRFSPGSNQPWRVMVGRRIPRDQVVLDLSVPLSREANSFIDNLQKLEGFTPPEQQGFLQLRPTFTARATADDNGTAITRENQVKASIDVKYRPNAQWVVDAALNPDFSQVALDVPQLSRNSRFALFLNEKRPVFLESRDLLNSPTSALYTRAIHDPRWVARASYRGDGTSGTALVAKDKGGGLTLLPGTYGSGAVASPANSTGLARVRRDGDGLTLGALASTRVYALGAGSNSHAAFDWQADLPDSWRSTGQIGASNTTAWTNASGKLTEQAARNGTRVNLNVNRRAPKWDFNLGFDAVSPDFRNDSGFVNQSGSREINGEIKHKAADLQFGSIRIIELHTYLGGQHTRDASRGGARGDTVSGWLTPGFWMQTAHNVEGSLELRAISLVRSDAAAPLMREKYVHGWANTTPGKLVSLVEGYFDVGQLADYSANRTRHGYRWGAFARTRLHPRLELEPKIDQLQFSSDGGGIALQETAVQLLGIWHLKPQHSLRLIAQSGRYRRSADASLGLAADHSSSSAQTFTYIWRQSNAQAFYAGISRGTQGALGAPKTTGTEAFVKLQMEL